MDIKLLKEKCVGKKLLILAGASVHNKLAEAAKNMGVYTIVTDYLNDSPAKNIADEKWMLNICDVDEIVDKCKDESVDGVITGWIDPCQRPYQSICDKLGIPCLGTFDQFFKMTDKHAFKEMCKENNVSVIPEYSVDQCLNGEVEFPLFVKPVDSRGSRGQSVCNTQSELENAIKYARAESSNGDILVEKYMGGANEFQVTYFFVNGEAYLIRTVDSYTGNPEDNMEKVVACSISPSHNTNIFLEKCNDRVIEMFKNLGIKNGPIFMQGFEKDGEFYFFDPGLRFPGVDYERIFTEVYGIDLMELMIIYALTGEMPDIIIAEDAVFLNGNVAAILFPTIKAGKIAEIKGYESLNNDKRIVSMLKRADIGDEIEWTYNVNQRLSEIDILCESESDLKETLNKIQNSIEVYDENGKDMIFRKFDTSRIVF